MKPAHSSGSWRGAFTLIELLLAVAIFAIVLAAINTAFYSALRLQRRTCEALDASHALNQALDVMRHDLLGTVPPAGLLSGDFKIGLVGTVAGAAQAPGIEFYTTTGILRDEEPWGEIQKVIYQLRAPLQRTGSTGKDLVRSVTRNLLATTVEEPEEQRLLQNVESLEFLGYTGMDWRNTWDTTLTDTNAPSAVRVRIQLASDNVTPGFNRQPLEMLVPLDAVMLTNAPSVSSSSGSSTSGGAPAGRTTGGGTTGNNNPPSGNPTGRPTTPGPSR